MQGCPGCLAFEPIFSRIASQEHRVNYAIVDLTYARDVVAKSRATSTPIHNVPLIMLYVNGAPHAKYNGKKNETSINSFITKALQRAPPASSSSFMREGGAGGGMYGGGGGRGGGAYGGHAPAPGHAGYSHQRPDGKVYMPDVKQPNLKGIVKGTGSYARLGEADEEDEDKLLIPSQVIPHNMPWEIADYATLGE